MASSKTILNRWRKAFPLAGFRPALNEPSKDDKRLAEQFAPLIYADPKLIEEEQADLARNLGIDSPSGGFSAIRDRLRRRDIGGVTDALHLFRVGRFPDDMTGARIGILGVDLPKSKFPWDNEMRKMLKQISERLRKEYAEKYFNHVRGLFESIFPTKSTSTCVIKYRVCRDPADTDIYCIQYFAYWPIQLFPRHWYDYEPFYVIVRKEGKRYTPLLITYNADFGIRPLVSGKRPGHIIRTFINWDSKDLQISPNDFDAMASYMTKAYGGRYHYQSMPSDKRKSHTDVLFGSRNRPALHIPKKWHSFDLCSQEVLHGNPPLSCELHPLKSQDLLHIGWEVLNPFQAPFLYPTRGKDNALMHFPLNAATLWHAPTYHRWNDYALFEMHTKQERPSKTVSNIYSYQVGLLIDLFSELSGESMGISVWPLIEARERELEDTLSLIRGLKRE